jgi:hypothetical protein
MSDAVAWLYSKGYRQNDNGVWARGNIRADINKSPANDGVVAVVFKRFNALNLEDIK